jgi:hypothetical protein
MMQKYQTMPKSTFCNFCKSVGHEDKDCRTLEMMKERTSDAYRMQVEPMTGPPVHKYNNAQQFTVPPQYIIMHANNIIKYHSIIHSIIHVCR